MEKSKEISDTPYTSKCKEVSMSSDEVRVPIHLKLTLTIKEAAEYSNIGINKIDTMLKQPNCPFVLYVGTRKLVKRLEFEEFIRRELTI
ncbi:TPA: excisionase [Clostridioides difficile]